MMVTSLITPSSFGGPIQSLISFSRKKNEKRSGFWYDIALHLPSAVGQPRPVPAVSLGCGRLEPSALGGARPHCSRLAFPASLPARISKATLFHSFSSQGTARASEGHCRRCRVMAAARGLVSERAGRARVTLRRRSQRGRLPARRPAVKWVLVSCSEPDANAKTP